MRRLICNAGADEKPGIFYMALYTVVIPFIQFNFCCICSFTIIKQNFWVRLCVRTFFPSFQFSSCLRWPPPDFFWAPPWPEILATPLRLHVTNFPDWRMTTICLWSRTYPVVSPQVVSPPSRYMSKLFRPKNLLDIR
jgi:hypothetical protein